MSAEELKPRDIIDDLYLHIQDDVNKLEYKVTKDIVYSEEPCTNNSYYTKKLYIPIELRYIKKPDRVSKKIGLALEYNYDLSVGNKDDLRDGNIRYFIGIFTLSNWKNKIDEVPGLRELVTKSLDELTSNKNISGNLYDIKNNTASTKNEYWNKDIWPLVYITDNETDSNKIYNILSPILKELIQQVICKKMQHCK